MVPQYSIYHSANLGCLLLPIWYLRATLLSWNCSIIPNYMIITPFCALKTFYLYIFPLLLQSSMYCNCCICECILLFHSPTLKIVKSRPEYSSFLYACILRLVGSRHFCWIKMKGISKIKYGRYRSFTHIPTIILFINLNLFFILDVKTMTKIDGMFIIYRNYVPNQKLTSFGLSACWNY